MTLVLCYAANPPSLKQPPGERKTRNQKEREWNKRVYAFRRVSVSCSGFLEEPQTREQPGTRKDAREKEELLYLEGYGLLALCPMTTLEKTQNAR